MARNLIATKLVESVRNRAMIPDDSDVYDDDKILDILNEQIEIGILDSLLTLNEEHLVTYTDLSPVPSDNAFRVVIPSRAIGSKLRDITQVLGNTFYEMSRITLEDLPIYRNTQGYQYTGSRLFYVEGDEIVVLPSSTINGVMRCFFHLRPNVIVLENNCAQISEINRETGVIQFTSVPNTFTSLTEVDFVQNKNPNKILAFDISIQSVNISQRMITLEPNSIPKRLTVGDWVCFPDTSPYPNIPTELHPLLAQSAAVFILEAMGDNENLGQARATLQKMQMSVQKLLDDRVEGAPRKIKSRHGFLSGNNNYYRRGKRY